MLRREGGGTPPTHDGPNLSGDLSESGRSKRGRRRNQKTEGSRKKIKTIEKVSILEELEEKVEVFDFSSARIKRCDVKVKTGDFSHYLQDLGLEQIKSPDSNLRKEDTSSGLNLEDEKEEVCEETSSSSRDSVAECSQQKEVVEANPYDDDDSGEDWYYGTTFTCLVCDYQSRVLKLFEKHVEEKHGCELKKFSKKYKVDGGKYACKICGSEVRHDKSDIDSHVQSHFLSLAKYGQLYEKKLNDIVERKRLIKEKKASGSSDVGTSQVEVNLSNLSEVAAPLKKAAETGNVERIISKADYRTEVKSKEKPETVDTSSQEETDGASVEPEIFENNNKISEQPTEYLSNLADKDHISFTIAEVNEVIHDMLTEEAEKSKSLGPPPLTPPPRPPPAVLQSELLKSPFPKSDDEIYIYCCPFQDCHYTCNFQASVI